MSRLRQKRVRGASWLLVAVLLVSLAAPAHGATDTAVTAVATLDTPREINLSVDGTCTSTGLLESPSWWWPTPSDPAGRWGGSGWGAFLVDSDGLPERGEFRWCGELVPGAGSATTCDPNTGIGDLATTLAGVNGAGQIVDHDGLFTVALEDVWWETMPTVADHYTWAGMTVHQLKGGGRFRWLEGGATVRSGEFRIDSAHLKVYLTPVDACPYYATIYGTGFWAEVTLVFISD